MVIVYSNSIEQRYFQTICMSVITIQSIVNVIFWYILWHLYNIGFSGQIIQDIVWGSTLIFTFITQLFALWITDGYLRQIRPSNMTLTRENLDIIEQRNNKTITLKDIEHSLDEDRMEMNLDYIQSGLRNIYENKLCFESLISSIFIMLFSIFYSLLVHNFISTLYI